MVLNAGKQAADRQTHEDVTQTPSQLANTSNHVLDSRRTLVALMAAPEAAIAGSGGLAIGCSLAPVNLRGPGSTPQKRLQYYTMFVFSSY